MDDCRTRLDASACQTKLLAIVPANQKAGFTKLLSMEQGQEICAMMSDGEKVNGVRAEQMPQCGEGREGLLATNENNQLQ
jgi:hypothetical protein